MQTAKHLFLLIGLAIAGLVMNGCPSSGGDEVITVPYTAGRYTDGTKVVPCYWTGTTRTDLPGDGTHGASAFSIYVSGGTVYTAGGYSNGSVDSIPCYWTGTTRTDLPGDGAHSAEAHSIFVQ